MMGLTIVPFAPAHAAGVAALNDRLAAHRVTYRMPAGLSSHGPFAVPSTQFVAEDEHGIHGGYVLRFQNFRIGAAVHQVGVLNLPLSEGVYDARYASLGLRLLADAQKHAPLLFALGIGGPSEPLARLLTALRWQHVAIPFYFAPLRGHGFLRNIRYLRRRPWQRWALDRLAQSRVPDAILGLRRRFCRKLAAGYTWQPVDTFGPWADALWAAAAPQLRFAAVRDAALLNRLYSGLPQAHGIRLDYDGKPVGWALLMVAPLREHTHFGNMTLATWVDGLSSRVHVHQLARACQHAAAARGADLLVTNQSDPAWRRGLLTCGFIPGPSNYLLYVNPALAQAVGPLQPLIGLHFNRGDGDGPIHLV